jgi:hypothetical protein
VIVPQPNLASGAFGACGTVLFGACGTVLFGACGTVLFGACGTVLFGACGKVLTVPLDDLPDWLPAWCLDHLGDEPADTLFRLQQVSMVFGLRLSGGRDVVVKARADDGRAVSCIAAQARLAGRGFPCARPLTPVVGGGLLIPKLVQIIDARISEIAARYGPPAPPR